MSFLRLLKRFFVASIIACALLIPQAFAENLENCPINDDISKQAAEGASKALSDCAVLKKKFEEQLESTITNSDAPCYRYTSVWYRDGFFTSEWYWGEHDKKGAEMDPDPAKNKLKEKFAAVPSFKYSDFDIGRYVNKNNGSLRDYMGMKTEAERNNDQKKVEEAEKELVELRKCETGLRNLKTTRQTLLDSRNTAHQFLAMLSGELTSTCKCSSDGTLNECTVIDDSYVEDHVDDSSCKTLADYVQAISVCPTCGLFETILNAVQRISKGTFDALATPLRKVIGLGFAIYLAYETLLAVASPATQKISKYLTTITTQGFRVAVTLVLLSNPEFVYGTLISPVIEGGLEFGLELLGDSKGLISQYAVKYTSFDTSNEYLTADFLQKIVGAAEAFNTMAATMPAIGQAMMCISWTDLTLFVIPHIDLLINGAIIYLFGWGICLAIGFYLLDCAIELGVICALMPFFVASWSFKMTAKYCTTGWNMIMNVFFNFVMMGVIISAAINITTQAISSGVTQDELENMINTNNIEGLSDKIDFGGMQILTLVVCCMIVFKMIKDVESLANKFAPGAGIQMGGDLGGTAMSALTRTGAAAGRGLLKAGNAGLEATGAKKFGNKIASKAKNVGKNALGKVGIGSKAKLGAKGRDKGGSGGGFGGV